METIKQYREAAHMSQRELSKALGVSQQAVASWETGVRTPRLGTLKQLCKIFDCSYSDLIGEPV